MKGMLPSENSSTDTKAVSTSEEMASAPLSSGRAFLRGLSKYDRTAGRFTNYYAADGIGGNQFYDRASCRLPDGTLAFGGTHGLTLFNPIDVPIKRNIPLLFSDLKIHNKLIRPQLHGGTIGKHLSYCPDIHRTTRTVSASPSLP